MIVWIQRHDFSSRDLEDTTVEFALNQLEITDWAAEDRLASEKQDAGEEFCPAGIGFVHPSGSILHLCPDGAGRMLVYYHYPEAGDHPTSRQESVSVERVPDDMAESLIRLHYSNDSNAILEIMGQLEQNQTSDP